AATPAPIVAAGSCGPPAPARGGQMGGWVAWSTRHSGLPPRASRLPDGGQVVVAADRLALPVGPRDVVLSEGPPIIRREVARPVRSDQHIAPCLRHRPPQDPA